MKIDMNLLAQFESQLDPQNLAGSPIPAKILGYGEISTIFQIKDDTSVAYKRMPLFRSNEAANRYARLYREYCDSLRQAGLSLPEDEAIIVASQRPIISLYIAQQQFPTESFVHRLIHQLEPSQIAPLIERVVTEIEKVWQFNRHNRPTIELSLDGQLSNWVWHEDRLYFIDTSTPLFRKNGVEQMDPEPLLRSAPGFLRWILRLFFLDDVMTRYYDQRLVYLDLTANLFKEGRPQLIPMVLEIINQRLTDDLKPLSEQEVNKYYREDRLIWTLFLSFRRIDRWIKTRVLHQRYEFILPGRIKR
ncbi:MAG: DUF6206 family protein [candidate division KSB1 bacterium]|nr:DUF6206 family protein [candidate division KSB1 bacterium]MDZ7358316.1 DUF6206 family protein [candidate division KSB1 bacterium]MDZ7399625.1 DUF6206 family protein [candidate division KSB1 bacterium]